MMDCFLISGPAFLDMVEYMNAVETEICGIGKIEKDPAGVAYLSEVKILPQQVTGTTVNVEEEDLDLFFQGMEQKEREKWCFNWHTHPTFGTSPSGVDTTNYSKMQEMFDLFIPFILNRELEFYLGLYTSYPWKTQGELKKIWPHELKKHYRKKPYVIQDNLQGKQFKHLLDVSGIRMTAERQDYINAEVKEKVIKPAPMVFTRAESYQTQWQRQQSPITTPQNQIIRVGQETTKDSAGFAGTRLPNASANLERHPQSRLHPDVTTMIEAFSDKDWRECIPQKNPHHMKKQELIWLGTSWRYSFNRKTQQFENMDEQGNLIEVLTIQQFKDILHEVYEQYTGLDDAHYERLATEHEKSLEDDLQAEIEENRSRQVYLGGYHC